MKTLIFGSKGYLGQYFLEMFPDAITPSADIADCTQVAALLNKHAPDLVINCAGKTGRPNVDWCEDHKVETVHANLTGPLVLLDECAKRGIYWVQIGSGCIYETVEEGVAFTEDDVPNFTGSFYSRTKRWIDQILQDFPHTNENGGGVLNLRIRMPFEGTDNPRSLINKIRNYDKFHDTPNSVTYMPDFMNAAKQLIEKNATGTYNIVNPGVSSPYSIMQMYKQIVDPSKEFEILHLEDLPDVHKTGRSNCILSTQKLESEGISMQPIEDAVTEALTQIRDRGVI